MNEVDAPSWLIPGLWDCKRAAALLKAGGNPAGAREDWSEGRYPDVEHLIKSLERGEGDGTVGLDMCLVARVASAVTGVVEGLGLGKKLTFAEWKVAGSSDPVLIHAGNGAVFAIIMPMRP